LAIGFSFYLIFWIFKLHRGADKMREISLYIQEGARSYLRQQYKVVSIFFLVVFLALLFMALKGLLVIFVPFAFLTGGFWSALCGWIGKSVSTRANIPTAFAVRESLNKGLRVAFGAGTVMGLMVVGLGLLDLAVWFWILKWWYTHHPLPQGIDQLTAVTSTMLCFGMGASSYALFARVGGGIYTKAADVGADLYESYVDSIIATMALAAGAGLGLRGYLFLWLLPFVEWLPPLLVFFL